MAGPALCAEIPPAPSTILRTAWCSASSRRINPADACQSIAEGRLGLHWQSGNSFGHSLEPGIFKIGYEANVDEVATGQSALTLGEAFAFDAVLRERCVNSLAEALPRILYDEGSKDGVAFTEVMLGIANRTTATADIVKESLDLAVRTGYIKVVSREGVARKKGASIRDQDIITLSKQQSIFLPAPLVVRRNEG